MPFNYQFKNIGYFLILLLLVVFTTASNGFVRLPRLVSNGMVLQRNVNVKIWGWADAGEKVIINFQDKLYTALANKNGEWFVLLDSMQAGGAYNMEIKGSNLIVLKNILVGDVWVCSGQSNMEFPMKRVIEKYPDEIGNSKNPYIRHFAVTTRPGLQGPLNDFSEGSWLEADPANTAEFSAIGYFFAKKLYAKYKVPIGLIRASVGGSPAEAWLSEETLHEFPKEYALAQKWKDTTYVQQVKQQEVAVNTSWYQQLWKNDLGRHAQTPWQDPAMNDSQWKEMKVPGYWADNGLRNVHGVVWYRKKFQVPAAMANNAARIFLGCIVDADSVYINGQFVGSTGYQYPPRRYKIPAGLLKSGENSIVVRIINTSGNGGFYLDKPYKIQFEKQEIDLKGNWKFALGSSSDPLPPSTVFHYQPMSLFNGMIAPILNFKIKGVIWYQGESNTSEPDEYAKSFPAVINDWRTKWQEGNFPFLYVQLANFMEAKELQDQSNWAETREVQLKTLSLENTCMAVAIDLGEWNDIHPLNKEDVGRRLALCAQKLAYGDKSIVASGPVYKSVTSKGNKMIITFSETGGGLTTKSNAPLKGFSIAGADKKFYNASAIIQKYKVVISSKEVPAPKYMRYAWADNPKSANLYNREGLPASPFRVEE